jgi:hypothetical protein
MKRILTGAAALRREDRLQQREDRLSDRVLDLRAQIAAKDARIAELEDGLTKMYESVKRYAALHDVSLP